MTSAVKKYELEEEEEKEEEEGGGGGGDPKEEEGGGSMVTPTQCSSRPTNMPEVLSLMTMTPPEEWGWGGNSPIVASLETPIVTTPITTTPTARPEAVVAPLNTATTPWHVTNPRSPVTKRQSVGGEGGGQRQVAPPRTPSPSKHFRGSLTAREGGGGGGGRRVSPEAGGVWGMCGRRV